MSTRKEESRPAASAAASTVRVGLIGKGIQRSKSPAMHEAEAAAQGFRCVYELIDLDDEYDEIGEDEDKPPKGRFDE